MSVMDGVPPEAKRRIAASTIALRVRFRCAIRPGLAAAGPGARVRFFLTFFNSAVSIHECSNCTHVQLTPRRQFNQAEGYKMDRRRFLEISAFAAMAVPAQEATAMQSVRLETSTPAMIIGPDEAHVYSMLGGGEARL